MQAKGTMTLLMKTMPNDKSLSKHGDDYVQMQHNDTIERRLATARPRLVHVARRYSVADEAIDDIVQDTLVVAWQRLDMLRLPDRFDAWLDGICRNMCLRWYERNQLNSQQLALHEHSEDMNEDVVDTHAVDPVEELQHEDLCLLLNRALGYLKEDTRELVELCYLAQLSQREVASRLKLSVDVLEARLHRARKRLRQVLNTELRIEALEFGLALDDEVTSDCWRPTRTWCWNCGHHRLEGVFEPLPNGLITFRMRCPTCTDIVNTGGLPHMDGLHSFRPALKRTWAAIHAHIERLELGLSFCPMCGERRPASILHPEELTNLYPSSSHPHGSKSALVIDCPSCDVHVETSVDSCLVYLPVVQHFIDQHPRHLVEPEALMEYKGQIALVLKISDFASAAQLTLFVEHRTLHVLAIYQT